MLTTSLLITLLAPSGPPPLPEEIVSWQRGGGQPKAFEYSVHLRTGVIDSNGNFVPSLGAPLRNTNWHRMIPRNSSIGFGLKYEHRSGALVSGHHGGDTFVPEIGSKVIDLATRTGGPGKSDRLVYNRLASSADYWTPELRAKYPNGAPRVPAPPAAGIPAGYELVPFAKAYPNVFPTGEPWVVRVIGDTAEFGHLEPTGDFVPEYNLPVMPRVAAPKPAPVGGGDGIFEWRFTYTLPPDHLTYEKAYEFRSGRLIKGNLLQNGNFAPEIGSTVLDFKDYDPKSAARIYNLPGVLRPVKKP